MGETNIHKTHKSQITYKPRSKIANQTQCIEFETVYWTHPNVIKNWYRWGSLESLHVIQQNSWWKPSGAHSRRSFHLSLNYVPGFGLSENNHPTNSGHVTGGDPNNCGWKCPPKSSSRVWNWCPGKNTHQNHTWGLKSYMLGGSRLILFT